MNESIWFNGEVMPIGEARVSVEDRGYQFADGVYEVIRIYNGKTFTLSEHLDRLERSAADIFINMPLNKAALTSEITKLIERNRAGDATVYLQLTRGCADRNHVFPDCKPTLLFYTRPFAQLPRKQDGAKIISLPDERWKRCWIKTIALLPNVLAKNAAIRAGADEAALIEDNVVTECSVSNFFAVVDGVILTHPAGAKVLPGITRLVLLDIARELGLKYIERAPRVDEVERASELFVTSTSREVGWVSHWNGRQIASKPGEITAKLYDAFRARIEAQCGALK